MSIKDIKIMEENQNNRKRSLGTKEHPYVVLEGISEDDVHL